MQPVVNLPSTCSFQPTPNNILPYNSMNQQSTTAAHLPLLSHSTVQKTADWSNAYLQQQSYLRNSYPPNLMKNYSLYQQSAIANSRTHLQATSSINRNSAIRKTPSTDDEHKRTKLPPQKEQSKGSRTSVHHKRGGDKISRSPSTEHKHKRKKLTPLRELGESRRVSTSRHHKRCGDKVSRFSRDKTYLNKSKTRVRSRDEDLRSVIRSVRRRRSISQLKDDCKDTRRSEYRKKCRLSPNNTKDHKVQQKSDDRRISDRQRSLQKHTSKRKSEVLSRRVSLKVERRHREQYRTNDRLENFKHSYSQNHSSKRKVEFSKSKPYRK